MTVREMTLKGKVVALFAVFLIFVPALCLFFFYNAVKAEIEKGNLSRMAFYAEYFEQAFLVLGADGKTTNFALPDPDFTISPRGAWLGRVTLIGGDGAVRYDSSGLEPGQLDNHIQRPEIQAALKGGTGSAVRYSATLHTHMHYYALKIKDSGGNDVFIRVAYPLAAVTNILYAFIKRSIFAVVSILAISFLFWLWLTKRLFQPLEKIIRHSEHVGTADARFPIFRDVELQKLSAALNTMSERLRSADADIQSRREELARIVEALPIGVVLMDVGRKVRYLNGVTRRLFGDRGDVVKGSPVERLIPSEEIYNMLDGPDACDMVSLTPPFAGPMEDALTVEVCVVTLATGRLMTLRDVTEERRLEETRRNLTIDAGHELQTPLTAIRAATELLLEALDEPDVPSDPNKKSLLSTILRQQERMTSLIDDLLLLVKLEASDKEPEERTNEDLMELLETVAAEFRENPAARAVVFEVKGPDGLKNEDDAAPFAANRSELLQAIFNIVDNAARKCGEKYGGEPGGRVRLELRKDKESERPMWTITIADNGPGVDPEIARRIFKSFHGSGARNRGKWGSGGHGLGLSIAARVVRVHGGGIDLLPTSPLGGAAFEIRLPA